MLFLFSFLKKGQGWGVGSVDSTLVWEAWEAGFSSTEPMSKLDSCGSLPVSPAFSKQRNVLARSASTKLSRTHVHIWIHTTCNTYNIQKQFNKEIKDQMSLRILVCCMYGTGKQGNRNLSRLFSLIFMSNYVNLMWSHACKSTKGKVVVNPSWWETWQ